MKTDDFQSCDHCWVFQIFWHTECSTFTASSFRIWNRSTGIPSPPLALFTVMLSKAPLTSHSRMSGSRWVITPLWLSGSWRSFFFFFYEDLFCTVLLCILATSSSLLLGPYHFCPVSSPSLNEVFPSYLIFLRRSLSQAQSPHTKHLKQNLTKLHTYSLWLLQKCTDPTQCRPASVAIVECLLLLENDFWKTVFNERVEPKLTFMRDFE